MTAGKMNQKKKERTIHPKTSEYHPRMLEIANALDISISNLLFEIGYKNPSYTMTQFKQGVTRLSDKLLRGMAASFPNVNLQYLKHGQTPILLKPGESRRTITSLQGLGEFRKVPYYRVPEGSNNDRTMKSWKSQADVTIFVSEFNLSTAYVECKSRMMAPEVRVGDIVAITKVKLDSLPQNEVCYIVTNDMYLFGRVKVHEKSIIVEFENPDFDTREIKRSKVLEIFKVDGLIRTRLN